MKKTFKIFAALGLSTLLGVTGTAHAESAPSAEIDRMDSIKATITYNFARFIQRPDDDHFTNSETLNLCVIDPTPSRVWTEFDGKQIGDRQLRIIETPELDIAGLGCEVAYIHEDLVTDIALRDWSNEGIVTISAERRFIKRGGGIRLVVSNNSAAFETNPFALRRAKAKISSKLLRVGMQVQIASK